MAKEGARFDSPRSLAGLMEGADAIEASRKRKDGLDGKPTEMPGSLKERIRANQPRTKSCEHLLVSVVAREQSFANSTVPTGKRKLHGRWEEPHQLKQSHLVAEMSKRRG